MTQNATQPDPVEDAPPPPPLLHRLIRSGHLRYWIILSWALALAAVAPWRVALVWFAVTMAAGLVRTIVDTRLRLSDEALLAHLRLAVATLSCVAWAAAPLLALVQGHVSGIVVSVALLLAGYTLVFTQMRAAPKEALIVSAPYSGVVGAMFLAVWGQPFFWVLLAIVPVVGLSLFIKVMITELKDKELETVNARQARLIAELEAARDRADAANAAKSNFLGVMSHELRTPMNGVLGAAQLLRMSNLDSRQAEFVGMITSSGEGLMVLLNDILDMTKIEAGKMELAPSPVEIAGLTKRLIGPFAAQAEAKGLAFVCETSGVFPDRFHADPLRLAQISHNLLANAIKFTVEGSVRLLIEGSQTPDGRLALKVAVADTGIGLTPEDTARLFQPFTQVDESSTRRFGGTGLGLSICRRLANLMGGGIVVESAPGRGSTFILSATFEAPDWAGDARMPRAA